jgi:tetratricopeptide (TPR) repeat protein
MDRLRPLWDFDDLDASEARFREQLEREPDDAGRAEVLTQLARIEGLRGNFDDGERLLERAGAAPVRVELERGRLLRSSGDPDAALPLFELAFAHALETGQWYLAGDAAHMAALAGDMHQWTQRGLDLAADQPDAAYWRGPLLNNLGWHHYEAGEYERALDVFERALEARKQDPGNTRALEAAHDAVAACRAELGR